MSSTKIHRKAYTRKDGTRVRATIYRRKTTKKPGNTTNHWFAPKKHTGWRKTQGPATRRSKLMDATDRRKSLHNRCIEAGRMAQALANVTGDGDTKFLATADAQYFFSRAAKRK